MLLIIVHINPVTVLTAVFLVLDINAFPHYYSFDPPILSIVVMIVFVQESNE